jgi:quinolinate synthase
LPWQTGSNPVEFGEELAAHQLAMLSSHIRTFNEQIEEEDKLAEIRQLVWDAETIVFLGFHFHKQNMDVLTSEKPLTAPTTAAVYATQVDRSDADIRKIHQRIQLMLGERNISSDSAFKSNCDCKTFFKQYASALSP